jgi:hypothetical protein
MLAGPVNLVEIDLLRGGLHTTAVPLDRLRERAGAFEYHVCIHQFNRPDDYFVAPIRLADRLPSIPIPLLEDAVPVMIDLQSLLDRCYNTGAYNKLIDYTRREGFIPLTDEQARWAEGILRSRNLLPAS